MKKFYVLVLTLLLAQARLCAQDLVTSAEAETGVLTGVTIAPQTSNSSGPYVTGFDTDGDKVTVTVTVPATATYKLGIQYRGIYGEKFQDIYANNVFVANVKFPETANFVELAAGTVSLNAGTNTITLLKSWGYMDVDKFFIYTVAPNVFDITPTLIDPQANTSTKNLYAFLLSQFGKKIISGQTNDYYDQLKTIAGKSPLLRAWDMASYSPQYAYKWGDNKHIFGAVDNHDAENAIAWYNGTGKKGIVSFHWHWHSPSGGTAGTNTFYTNQTSFDVSQAVIAGTQQNLDVIRDIDAIAVQLKKLQDADVPVIWRPLHEAGGAWFWWGAKGSGPAKALWDIMYDRITNFHGIHNLIWSWSSPEADWYPGNAKVDILGYDSYPGEFNYTPQKNIFDNLFSITQGKKILAMTENGPIPDIQKCFAEGAVWSYFTSWVDLVTAQNSTQHIVDVFNHASVITLENVNDITLPITLTGFKVKVDGSRSKIEWFTTAEQNNDRFEVLRSSDGIHFYPLGTVKANAANGYFIYDNNPSKGTNYYRLLQYNTDGKRTDLGIKTIRFNLSAQPVIKAYPNPAKSNVGVLLRNFEGSSFTITITDLSGKKLHQQTMATSASEAYYSIRPASQLSAGFYLLQVSGQGLQESMKVLVK